MKVCELRRILDALNDDMDVIIEMRSDYAVVETAEVINAVIQEWGVMRSHATMSDENKEKAADCLLISY